MKISTLIICMLLIGWASVSTAQNGVPQMFKYQGVAKINGNIVTGNIGLQISIREGGPEGSIILQERFFPKTNDDGVFVAQVGTGLTTQGSFSNINWLNGLKYLQVEMDPNGGANYKDLGSRSIGSVPFAQIAAEAINKDDADASPINELQSLALNGTQISLSDANTIDLAPIIPPGVSDDQQLSLHDLKLSIEGGNTVDLSVIQDGVEDADASTTNEIQSLALNGTEISLSDANTIDLAPIIPPGGSDDQQLSLHNLKLSIEGGNTIDLSGIQDGVEDADASTTNEIQSLALNGTEISLSDANTIDLAPIIPPGGSDDQKLSLQNFQLSIENGNTVDLSSIQDGVEDADASTTNEIQSLALNGTEISLSDANSIDLAPIIPPGGSDDQKLSLQNFQLSIENGNTVDLSVIQDGVEDADASTTNELQTLSFNPISGALAISAGNSVNIPKNTDDQKLTLTGNLLFIEHANSVNLAKYANLWQKSGQDISYVAGNVGVTAMNIAGNAFVGNQQQTRLTTDTQHSGYMGIKGPNGYHNVIISSLNGSANSGIISLYDANNANKAGVYVDQNGEGIVYADQKNFRMAHPGQAGKEIWYGSLEGPELAAYFRATAKLENGKAFVQFPEHFQVVANTETMTVVLTPLSSYSKGLAVVKKSADGFEVAELLGGSGNYAFDWEVKCVRKGYEDYRVIRDSSEVMTTGIERKK